MDINVAQHAIFLLAFVARCLHVQYDIVHFKRVGCSSVFCLAYLSSAYDLTAVGMAISPGAYRRHMLYAACYVITPSPRKRTWTGLTFIDETTTLAYCHERRGDVTGVITAWFGFHDAGLCRGDVPPTYTCTSAAQKARKACDDDYSDEEINVNEEMQRGWQMSISY